MRLKMTRSLTALSLILLAGTHLAQASEAGLSKPVLQKLKDVGLSIQHTEPSPVPGIFTVVSQEGVSYVDSSGDYIFTGSLFRVNGKEIENTTEQAVLQGVRNFANSTKTVTFKAANEKYVVGIFTDITCGYCQKLH